MAVTWITYPAFLAVHLGFSGLFGLQLYHLRYQLNLHQVAAALGIGGLVLLSPLSMPAFLQWIGWLAAILVVGVFALRPQALPDHFWSWNFAWRYSAVAMGLVALWAWGYALTLPTLLLGGLALLAAGLAWRRAKKLSRN